MSSHDNRPQFNLLSQSPFGIVGVFQDRPNKYMMLLSFAQEILREESYLSSREREIIAAYTSRLNGCEYCCGSHTAFSLSLGATEDDLSMIATGDIENHPLSSILKYVNKLTLNPSSISDKDKQLVHDQGFSEEQLKDAIAVCAAFNLYNRIVEGHGIAPRDSYEQDVEMINLHGYDRRY